MKVAHAFVTALIKFTLRLYYFKIKVEGLENIPKDTPLLVTPNHQNAFLDPFLVGAFIGKPLYYLTRQDVFARWNRPLLRMMNMIPIYRIRDGYAKLSLNDAVFESCRKLFDDGESILIFAEGNHGKHYYLRPLTKGAARLALQFQEKSERDLMVLPVGLNYFEHQQPRSTVLIKYGTPIPVTEYLKGYHDNQAKGLVEMREAISAGMKATLVIPEEKPDYEKRVKAVFQEKHEDYTFEELRSIDSEKVAIDSPRKKKRHSLAWTLNPFPMLLIKRIIGPIEDVVFHSSLKYAVGLFAFPIWWLLVFFTMSLLVGINIALLTVIVMVFGLFYSYQR